MHHLLLAQGLGVRALRDAGVSGMPLGVDGLGGMGLASVLSGRKSGNQMKRLMSDFAIF